MKKKKNFLEKLVKRDYNNELEKILEQKKFDPNVKSILLGILYKIEMGYQDCQTVKRDIETKDEYIDNFFEIIKNDCNNIKIINMSEKTNEIPVNKTYTINKSKKQITAYPIERKLLYAIYKISNKDNIVKDDYFILSETISELINVGYNIDKVEALRDFNGYSWTTIPQEIESIDYNLVYQILRILCGYQFLNKWVKSKEFIIDYYEEFKELLQTQYGRNSKEILDSISKISIILSIKYDKKNEQKFLNAKKELEDQIKLISDKMQYTEKLTKEKIEITKKIKEIDSILNDKKLLDKEYKKRNKELPLEKKIFSMKALSKILINERELCEKNLLEINNLLNPRKFVKYEKSLEEKYEYVSFLKSKKNIDDLEELKIQLLKIFLKNFKKNIEKCQTKIEIENLIYEFRYFLLLPYDNNKRVKDIEEIKKAVKEIEKKLINKAIEMKFMNQISKNEEVDYSILEKFFDSRAISILDIKK